MERRAWQHSRVLGEQKFGEIVRPIGGSLFGLKENLGFDRGRGGRLLPVAPYPDLGTFEALSPKLSRLI